MNICIQCSGNTEGKEAKISWSCLIREVEKWAFEQDIEGTVEI